MGSLSQKVNFSIREINNGFVVNGYNGTEYGDWFFSTLEDVFKFIEGTRKSNFVPSVQTNDRQLCSGEVIGK